MTHRSDFTPQEWALLARAPFMTGLIVTLASPSGISGVLEESSAVSQDLLAAGLEAATPALIRELIEDIQDSKGQLARPAAPLTPGSAAEVALESLRQAAALLGRRATPDEAAVFKDWLILIAQDAARAAKEGGFLGIGGVQVSEAERAALRRIREALGAADG